MCRCRRPASNAGLPGGGAGPTPKRAAYPSAGRALVRNGDLDEDSTTTHRLLGPTDARDRILQSGANAVEALLQPAAAERPSNVLVLGTLQHPPLNR